MGRILIFSAIFFGLGVTEAVSNNVLPLTLKRMTKGFAWSVGLPFRIPGLAPDGAFIMGSALVIGLVLAHIPFFGFSAQPLVGVVSDRVWTRSAGGPSSSSPVPRSSPPASSSCRTHPRSGNW